MIIFLGGINLFENCLSKVRSESSGINSIYTQQLNSKNSINQPPVIISILPPIISIKLPEYKWIVFETTGTVEYSVNDGPWELAIAGMRLPFCTKIMTGFESGIILKRGAYYCEWRKLISDEWCKITGLLTKLHLGEDSLSYQKNVPKLKRGKIFIKKQEIRTDWRVSTPRLTTAVKGTRFSVSHYSEAIQDTIELLEGTLIIKNLLTSDTAEVVSLGKHDAKIIFVSDSSINISSYPSIDTTLWDFGAPSLPVWPPYPASVELTVSGENFVSGARVFIEPTKGIQVDTTVFINNNELRALLTISRYTTAGLRDVIVTNPDLQSDTIYSSLLIKPNPPPTPYIARVEPTYCSRGDTINFLIHGEHFFDSSMISFIPSVGISIDSLNISYHNVLRAKLIISEDASVGPRNVVVTNSDGRADTLYNGFFIQSALNINILPGWNMVSVPLIVANYLKDTLFPTSISNAFTYQGAYFQKDTLQNSIGYWLKFIGQQNVNISGLTILSDSIDVAAGWNMIGSISSPVTTSSITTEPPNIISSFYYGYKSGYRITDTIQPGKGYWIKVNQPGKLFLSSGGFGKTTKPTAQSNFLNDFNLITLIDINKQEQKLYFGNNPKGKFSIDFYEMPPLSPSGIFDARFASQSMLEVIKEGRSGEFPIQISSAEYPLTISWEMKSSSISALLKIGDEEIRMSGVGNVKIADSDLKIALKLTGSVDIPIEFALEQNYPNPFNPTTTIRFDLPEQTRVVLKIYDILGQEIITLVNGGLNAGTHSYVWDGKNQIGTDLTSGIYLYRIETNNFQKTMKLLLLR